MEIQSFITPSTKMTQDQRFLNFLHLWPHALQKSSFCNAVLTLCLQQIILFIG